MARPLLTERDVVQARGRGERQIAVPAGTLITPLARDAAAAGRVTIVIASAPSGRRTVGPQPLDQSRVALGTDPVGVRSKPEVSRLLRAAGYTLLDVDGTGGPSPSYVEAAREVARSVAGGAAWRGILLEATGTGGAIVANRVPGVRAVAAQDLYVARRAREEQDCNVLVLGVDVVATPLMSELVRLWLETWSAGGSHRKLVEAY